MTEEQASAFWAFVRGDLDPKAFEKWLSGQDALEAELGEDLYLDLVSADFRDLRDAVPQLRSKLETYLKPLQKCECPAIRDTAAIPMGGDFYFEKVFNSLNRIVDFGPEKWWLYISKCRCCATVWLIAQDDRIYDEFYFQRINEAALADAKLGQWPAQFQTYEALLSTGRKLSEPPSFFDPMAGSLQWAVEDLLRERPTISTTEISYLLGLSKEHSMALIGEVQSPTVDDKH